MPSHTVAALDSLAAALVPKLPAASQMALERTARYYMIQALANDIGLVLIGGLMLLLIKMWVMPAIDKEEHDDTTMTVIGIGLGIVGSVLFVIGLCATIYDIPFFFDPVTGTILRTLGK